jgi:hypothetical protein
LTERGAVQGGKLSYFQRVDENGSPKLDFAKAQNIIQFAADVSPLTMLSKPIKWPNMAGEFGTSQAFYPQIRDDFADLARGNSGRPSSTFFPDEDTVMLGGNMLDCVRTEMELNGLWWLIGPEGLPEELPTLFARDDDDVGEEAEDEDDEDEEEDEDEDLDEDEDFDDEDLDEDFEDDDLEDEDLEDLDDEDFDDEDFDDEDFDEDEEDEDEDEEDEDEDVEDV